MNGCNDVSAKQTWLHGIKVKKKTPLWRDSYNKFEAILFISFPGP